MVLKAAISNMVVKKELVFLRVWRARLLAGLRWLVEWQSVSVCGSRWSLVSGNNGNVK